MGAANTCSIAAVEAGRSVDVDVTDWAYWDLRPSAGAAVSAWHDMDENKTAGSTVRCWIVFKTTYVFLFSAGGRGLIFVLAAPGPRPDIDKVRAFLVGPDVGVLARQGRHGTVSFCARPL
jgi:hypothetical protein